MLRRLSLIRDDSEGGGEHDADHADAKAHAAFIKVGPTIDADG